MRKFLVLVIVLICALLSAAETCPEMARRLEKIKE